MTGYFRTAILLAAMTALFMAVGALIGGQSGMMIALVFAVATNLFAWWKSGDMVLSMYGAREVDARSAPELYAMTAELARRANLPMPRLYIIESPQPNAFATGRSPENAAVAVNSGLLTMLDRNEVAGVVAHELAHIKHRDTLLMTVTATLAGAISMLANFGMFFGGNRNENGPGIVGGILVAILAPLAAMVVQMAVSRSREYEADRLGAEISAQPMALASALSRIERGAHAIPDEQAEANPATAHMFIINPLSGGGVDNLFSTHPSTENRIAALQEIARAMGASATASSAPSPRGEAPRRSWRTPQVPQGEDTQRGPWS